MTNHERFIRGQAEVMRLERGPSCPIDIRCSDEEAERLVACIDWVEGWLDDPDRVRFVFKDGTKGKWFSRQWKNLTLANVA